MFKQAFAKEGGYWQLLGTYTSRLTIFQVSMPLMALRAPPSMVLFSNMQMAIEDGASPLFNSYYISVQERNYQCVIHSM